VYADLKATRHDQYPPQVTDEECDFRNDDSASEQVLHINTGPVLINPLENDVTKTKNQTRCFSTVPPAQSASAQKRSNRSPTYRTTQTTMTKETRPKSCVPAKQSQPIYLLGTSKVAKADDGFDHVAPDLVSVEKTNIPNKYKVTLLEECFKSTTFG